jgi:hypothetical protein
MVRKKQLTPEERKRWHAELAKRPGLHERIAEATAEYKKLKANGGLRRLAAAKSNRRTR